MNGPKTAPGSRSRTKKDLRVFYYSRHIGDYRRDAGHLTLIQEGAYCRLLDLAYSRGGPIPSDHIVLYALCRLTTKSERTAVDQVIGMFWQQRRDGYHQKRVDREIAKMVDFSEKRSAAAKRRWEGDKADSKGSADAMQVQSKRTANQNPISILSKARSSTRKNWTPAQFGPSPSAYGEMAEEEIEGGGRQ